MQHGNDHKTTMTEVPSPLYRDLVYDGAADPVIIWNKEEQEFWMFYTCRRANLELPRYAFAMGTDIGIASAKDGVHFIYRGTANIENIDRGRNTFWAPEIIYDLGEYHMFVTYIKGTGDKWQGERRILHHTSQNLWDWTFRSVIPLNSSKTIDAAVVKRGGGYLMFYKNEERGQHTYKAESPDLYGWSNVQPVLTDHSHEGPNVFHFHGYYWLITDPWDGLDVYRSDDCEKWTACGRILHGAGTKADDTASGHHADVLVQGDKAYIYYFTHPGTAKAAENSDYLAFDQKRSSILMAELVFNDGALEVKGRNEPLYVDLLPGVHDEFFPGHTVK